MSHGPSAAFRTYEPGDREIGKESGVERGALLDTMRSMRADLERVVMLHRDEPDREIGGGWTLHDAVAHLALWDRMAIRRIAGTPLPEGEEVASREPWDLDAFNDEMRSRIADRPMADVLAEFEASYRTVVAAVEAADDESCRPGGAVWTAIDDDGAGHYPQHVAIRDLLMEQQRARTGDS